MAHAKTRALLTALSLISLALAACSRQQGGDEMSWARAALERNDRVEIVAADPQSRTFTVRSKDTGQLHIVRADQLIAAPAPPAGASATAPAASAAPAPVPAAEEHPALAAPAPTASATVDNDAAPAREAATPAPAAEPRVFASRALQPGSL